ELRRDRPGAPAYGDGDQQRRDRLGRHARGTAAYLRACEHRPGVVGEGIRADIVRGGVDVGRWDEARWEGKPGERSIWLIKATGSYKPQAVQRMTLESDGIPVRQYLPYAYTGQSRLPVIQVPQPLIAFSEDRGNVWSKWIAPGLDLGQGVGAV